MAGIYVNALFKFDNVCWIVDNAATNHSTRDSRILHNVRKLSNEHMVSLPNGEVILVDIVGDFILSKCLILKEVLVVPCFKMNLLSVCKLISDTKNAQLLLLIWGCMIQELLNVFLLGILMARKGTNSLTWILSEFLLAGMLNSKKTLSFYGTGTCQASCISNYNPVF